MQSPQTTDLQSNSKIKSKTDKENVANNNLKSGLKSTSKTGEELKIGGQKATEEAPNSSIPANRLEELDLNNCVIEITDMKFTYNKANGYLLDGITMTFPRSAIYGFLGPSGCGKTTIIKIITGLLKPSSGTILVNGKEPRHPKNQIPGPGIGYMPQEICLLEAFTIKETFIYFSQIYGLSKEYRNKRIDFLMNFLELPDKNQRVGNLSGGQQRRTSLGVAIIHNPPILILDEPTVGVDPMLRERIWKHLLQLSSEEKTSIMITTHYIGECSRAHVIGLMRNGKLLAESSPNILLTFFKTDNLEAVFLKLCRAEEEKLTNMERPPDLVTMRTTNTANRSKDIKSSIGAHCKPTSSKRFWALVIKNSIVIWKNKLTLTMEIFLPVIILVLFAIAIGNKPKDLEIALNSEEKRNTSVDDIQKLSQTLLRYIDNKTIILKDYPDQKSAIESVKNGETFGVLYIDGNFTSALKERASKVINDEVLRQSTIFYSGDMSDLNIHMVIFRELFESMFKFVVQMVQASTNTTDPSLMANPNALKPLIEHTKPPIYGTSDPLFKEFLLPGMIVTGSFLLASALTGLSLIEDRRKGLFERSLVAGVKVPEILIGMILVHMLISILQAIIVIITVYIVFQFTNEGNYLLILLIIVFQTVTGMCLGLMISTLANDAKMAIVIVTSTIIPFLLISGIIWPLEGMEYSLFKSVSFFLPQTMSIKVLRAITQKGWSLNRLFVWWGYIMPIAWSLIFVVLATIFSQFRTD